MWPSAVICTTFTVSSARPHHLQIFVFDPDNGNLEVMLEGHDGVVYAVKWSPDFSLLASGGAGGCPNECVW